MAKLKRRLRLKRKKRLRLKKKIKGMPSKNTRLA